MHLTGCALRLLLRYANIHYKAFMVELHNVGLMIDQQLEENGILQRIVTFISDS